MFFSGCFALPLVICFVLYRLLCLFPNIVKYFCDRTARTGPLKIAGEGRWGRAQRLPATRFMELIRAVALPAVETMQQLFELPTRASSVPEPGLTEGWM